MTAAEPALLPSQKAAAYIGRNVKYLRRLTAQRRLAFIRQAGGHLRLDRRDLDAFLDRHHVEALPW